MARLLPAEDATPGADRRRSFIPTAIIVFAASVFVVILGLLIWLQWRSRAFGAEFGTLLSDEPAHYINGLLVADYLRHGQFKSPLAFAQSFYLQYPKVTIGHWPPAFYLAEGIWMLLVSASRASMLVFSALITASLAVLVGIVVRGRMGSTIGAAAALAFVMVPVVRNTTLSLMLDPWIALLGFAATLLYIQYLNTWRWLPAVLFALFASGSILSKGNGVALALLPLLALLVTREFSLLRRATFWMPALIVIALCGPWTWLTYKATADGFFYAWGLDYTRMALGRNGSFLLQQIGPVGLVLAFFALLPLLRPGAPADEPAERRFRAGMFSLFASVFIFQAIVPASVEARYMLPALPPLVVLIVLGFRDLLRWVTAPAWRRKWSWFGLPASLALFIGLLAPEAIAIREPVLKPLLGMVPAVHDIIARLQPSQRALVLVGGGGESEGSFITETAMQDRTRRIVIVRGLSLLSSGSFSGRDYRARFDSAAAVASYVKSVGVRFVIIDTSWRSLQWRHMRQLIEAVKLAGWPVVGRYPHDGVDGETLLYRIDQNREREPDMAWLARTVGPRSPF